MTCHILECSRDFPTAILFCVPDRCSLGVSRQALSPTLISLVPFTLGEGPSTLQEEKGDT